MQCWNQFQQFTEINSINAVNEINCFQKLLRNVWARFNLRDESHLDGWIAETEPKAFKRQWSQPPRAQPRAESEKRALTESFQRGVLVEVGLHGGLVGWRQVREALERAGEGQIVRLRLRREDGVHACALWRTTKQQTKDRSRERRRGGKGEAVKGYSSSAWCICSVCSITLCQGTFPIHAAGQKTHRL